MRVGSAFAGIGGFDLAFQRADCDVVWQIEIDKHCNQVLAEHWPGVKRYGDINTVLPDELETVDVLTAGFPCQDVSVAGKREGLHGKRTGLFFKFMEIVRVLRPSYVVLENVPGLLSSQSGRDFGTVLGALAELGFDIEWRVLDAQFFGLPQRRKRVFIVGCLGDGLRAGEILLEPGGGCWDPPTRREQGSQTPGDVGTGSSKSGRALLSDTGVVSSLSHRMGTSGHGDLANAQAGWLFPFRKSTRAHGPDDYETWEEAEASNTLDGIGNSTRTSHAVVHAFSVYPQRGQGSQLAARETDLATALSATDGKMHDRGIRITDDLGVRRLTPLECERLQGYPDFWTACVANTPRYRMLGNAIAVPVAEWIVGRMLEQHGA